MTGSPPSRLEVRTAGRSYTVSIEAGLLNRAGEVLAPYARGGRLIVISDEAAWAAQGSRLADGLAGSRLEAVPFLLSGGEGSKSWSVLSDTVERLLEMGVERSDTIIAFGGGVVGDLTGFAAAILKRGCNYVQIPTTLLAQVDSSVGGKTGINARSGKNLVGAFHPPAAVLIDPDTLDTLPLRQLRAGYAEVVKYGLIGDADFFAWCEHNVQALLAGDPGLRQHAIAVSIAAKAAIVRLDERETNGRRALLNLGHTFGHALEMESGFSDRLLHGEAVALGMALAFRFSAERGLCPREDAGRVEDHLRTAGLPTRLAEAGLSECGTALAAHMMHDKKARNGRVSFVLARGIGEAFFDQSVSLDEIAAFLDRQ